MNTFENTTINKISKTKIPLGIGITPKQQSKTKILTIIRIISETWEADKTIKMLEFCRDNPNATEAQLSGMSSKISSEHKKETQKTENQ